MQNYRITTKKMKTDLIRCNIENYLIYFIAINVCVLLICIFIIKKNGVIEIQYNKVGFIKN